jgi:hypothetical protein
LVREDPGVGIQVEAAGRGRIRVADTAYPDYVVEVQASGRRARQVTIRPARKGDAVAARDVCRLPLTRMVAAAIAWRPGGSPRPKQKIQRPRKSPRRPAVGPPPERIDYDLVASWFEHFVGEGEDHPAGRMQLEAFAGPRPPIGSVYSYIAEARRLRLLAPSSRPTAKEERP